MSQPRIWRLFAPSGSITLIAVLAVLLVSGWNAALLTLILIAVEIAFSFDNAIINAEVLRLLPPFWQRLFLTLGVIIAVFGMRLLFPIAVVALSARLPLGAVWDMALHHPLHYSHELQYAHPVIAAYGGGFLLLLALNFFMFDNHEVVWLEHVERRMQQIGNVWLPAVISLGAVIVLGILAPLAKQDGWRIATAGFLGIGTFLIVHSISAVLGRTQQGILHRGKAVRGWQALGLFIYLEILDASFSFDGVVGAFAITDKLLLIALGLGIGALWVRSLTVYMVRRGALERYIYLEHGAHYTIAVVAIILLLSIFFNVPDILVGLIGLGIIYSSFLASRQAMILGPKK